jgi:hypothetical protein
MCMMCRNRAFTLEYECICDRKPTVQFYSREALFMVRNGCMLSVEGIDHSFRCKC